MDPTNLKNPMQQPQSGIVLPAFSLARTFLTTAINHDPYFFFYFFLFLSIQTNCFHIVQYVCAETFFKHSSALVS
jgi:hypothetical protein